MLKRITIKGYKSIRDMSLELRPLNVLIGANGAGKSNLLSFFSLLSEMMSERFQTFVARSGGASSISFLGSKQTKQIVAELQFDLNERNGIYRILLEPAAADSMMIAEEEISCFDFLEEKQKTVSERGLKESRLRESHGDEWRDAVWEVLRVAHTYHFLDTTLTSPMRSQTYVRDSRRIWWDGQCLAAVLHRLKNTRRDDYSRIVRTVQQFAPWFGDFVVEPLDENPDDVRLDWQQKGSDAILKPSQLSDGTLRAIALVTLLLQPRDELPGLLIIDEPELGLHPDAIGVLAALIHQVSHYTQVLVATQSTTLLDHFDPGDVVVVDREVDSSVFRHLGQEELAEWVDDFALSELWEKNILGGGPFA